jgi:Sigma-70, region 4
MSIAEVAELTGVPVNTVKTRMFRARALMGELLKGYDIERLDSLDDSSDGTWSLIRSGRSAVFAPHLEGARA